MEKPRPAVVPMDSVRPYEKEEAPTGVKIARLVTKGRCGSNLMTGVCWMPPGDKTVWWSAYDTPAEGTEHHYGPVDETYFIIRGRLRLHYDEGYLDFGPNDAVYLAPGWRYQLENVGDEDAFFVYSMYPSQE